MVSPLAVFSFAFLASAPQEFESGQVISAFADDAVTLAHTDADLDGDTDILTIHWTQGAVILIENLGNDQFHPGRAVTTNRLYEPWRIGAADLDGDGDEDLITLSLRDNKISWHASDGAGNYGARQVVNSGIGSGGPFRFDCQDLEGDGDLDLVWATAGGTIYSVENQGGGVFANQQRIRSVDPITELSLDDVNQDGLQDIVFNTGDGVYSLLNNGNGNWASPVTVYRSGSTGTIYCSTTGDLNADGLPDLVWGYSGGFGGGSGLYWSENLGGGSFSSEVQIHNASSTFHSIVDLDHDGIVDIVASEVFQIVVHKGLGGGAFLPAAQVGASSTSTLQFTVADMNSDGLLDVVGAYNQEDSIISYKQKSVGLQFEVRNLVACSIAEFELTGATPGDLVIMGYSLAGPGPTATQFGVVDMTPPIEQLASIPADAQGAAVHMQKVPPQASGIMLYTQATSGGELSNSLAIMIL